MTTYVLSPLFNGWQGFNAAGQPLNLGTITVYVAGSTTQTPTWTTSAGSVQNSNPITLANGFPPNEIWLAVGTSYKFVVKDASGATINTYDNVTSQSVPFVAIAPGATTTVFQAALNAATSGQTIFVLAGSYSLASLTVAQNNVTLWLDEGAVLSFPTLGSGVKAITVTGTNFTICNGKLQGPASGVYVANEDGIYMLGTSTSARKSGLRIYGTEICNFGSHGVYGQFVDDIVIDEDCHIHDCGYAGAMFLSCNHGRVANSKIKTITPGTASNMYGLSLTHDTTNYSADPNAGTKAAVNPFCWDWVVEGNRVESIAWEGIDCHGGYEIVINDNHVYATRNGIACSSSSGGAANYAGWNNKVTNNVVDAANADGTVSGYENLAYGINCNGGSTVKQQNLVLEGNTVSGHGVLGSITIAAIQHIYNTGASVNDNTVKKWGGAGFYYGNSTKTSLTFNKVLELGGAAAGSEYAFHNDTAAADDATIIGNVVSANGGTAARIGLRSTLITTLPFLEGNDFSAATVSAYSMPALFSLSSEGLPTMNYTVNNGGTGETIDISPMIRYREFILSVTSSNALTTVTNLVSGASGQRVMLYSPGATAWTFTAANARLAGGATFAATQYDTLALALVSATWIEQSRSANA